MIYYFSYAAKKSIQKLKGQHSKKFKSNSKKKEKEIIYCGSHPFKLLQF